MALSLISNVASLNAQQSLNNTSSALSTSLQRLSTGLKINTGADGPAALVISQQQSAQIAGLQTATANTNQAVSVVQTAEGALNEVSSLLVQIRGLALSSANAGVNDASALAANQAQIANALSTIDNIANTTQFGSKNLLNGAAAITGTADTTNAANAQNITTGSNVAAGNYTLAITTQGTGGSIAGAATNGNSLAASGTLSLTGGGLTSAVSVALQVGDNVNTAATKIQAALDAGTASGGGAGKFVVSVNAGAITIKSNILGSSAVQATTTSQTGTQVDDVVGLTAGTGTAGVAAVATLAYNGGTAINLTPTAGPNGLNNQFSFGGTTGLNFALGVSNGQTSAASTSTISVADNSLVFQIGANQNETAKISIAASATTNLGTGVVGLKNASTTSLSKIDVTTTAGAQDAISVVDAAIAQVSNQRASLGAFQTNTLQANAANLATTLTNTTAAESVIRDTDFASEIANYTKLQTQLQAGSTVLSNANSTTALIAQLLQKA